MLQLCKLSNTGLKPTCLLLQAILKHDPTSHLSTARASDSVILRYCARYKSTYIIIIIIIIIALSGMTLNDIMTLKYGLEVTQVHSSRYHSNSWVRFSPSIVTMALSCIICDTKRDIGRKSWFFHTPLHSTPPLGGPHRNIATPFGMGKLEWWGQPTVKKTFRICITV